MFGNKKQEFGDYQTPIAFCEQVCDYLLETQLISKPDAVLEPTCGIGNFLKVCQRKLTGSKLYGVDINWKYAEEARQAVPTANIVTGNIFDLDVSKLCTEEDVLIIGNPPWATNAELSYNLPQKVNFKGLRGMDALTGSSNFDICEYIILRLIEQFKNTNSTICMLCKTSVARNVLLELSRNKTPCKLTQMLSFNSNKVFGISAASCVLIIKLSSGKDVFAGVECEVKDFETLDYVDTLKVNDGIIRSTAVTVDLEGKSQFVWRQGVKHDCGKVMELDIVGNDLLNKYKETVSVERDLVFPLVKSSHFKKPIITDFSKYVIVTQRKARQETSYIQQQHPKTWAYLTSHIDLFRKRKSVIYANAPDFSMFGVGDYSFAPYKVGVSGFYKKPLFALMYSEKPVMTDDTAYFLPFDDYDTAYCMMLLLNSETVQRFLQSMAFLDSKRPYTVKLLSRIDFRKCVEYVSFEEMRLTEKKLDLEEHITPEKYADLTEFICS